MSDPITVALALAGLAAWMIWEALTPDERRPIVVAAIKEAIKAGVESLLS
jgi:hypothetical protein